MEFMKVMCTVMMFMNAFQPCRCIVKPCPLFKDHVILTAKRDNPIVKFSFSPYDSPSCVKPDAEIMSLEVSGISTSAAFANIFCQWFPGTTGTAHSAQNRSQNCTYNAYQRHFTLLLPVNGTEDQRWKVECRVKQSPSDEEVRLVGKLTIRMEASGDAITVAAVTSSVVIVVIVIVVVTLVLVRHRQKRNKFAGLRNRPGPQRSDRNAGTAASSARYQNAVVRGALPTPPNPPPAQPGRVVVVEEGEYCEDLADMEVLQQGPRACRPSASAQKSTCPPPMLCDYSEVCDDAGKTWMEPVASQDPQNEVGMYEEVKDPLFTRQLPPVPPPAPQASQKGKRSGPDVSSEYISMESIRERKDCFKSTRHDV